MRLSEEDKKCIKILYRNGLNVKEIEKWINEYPRALFGEHIINRSLNKNKLKKEFKNIIKNNF